MCIASPDTRSCAPDGRDQPHPAPLPRRRAGALLAGRLRDAAGRQLRRWQRTYRGRHPLGPAPARSTLFPLAPPASLGGWVYHDETWIRVVHRSEHRRLLREGRSLSVVDDFQSPPSEVRVGALGESIHAELAPRPEQQWVWLHLQAGEQMWRNFRWKFRVRRDSDFRELQFGFRYVDFYNRYRFRHEDDCLHFDIVANGEFHNSIYKVPFRMTLGRTYRWSIEARDRRFVLAVDGAVVLDEVDRRDRFPRGPIAVVFWEDDGATPIRVAVSDMQVVET